MNISLQYTSLFVFVAILSTSNASPHLTSDTNNQATQNHFLMASGPRMGFEFDSHLNEMENTHVGSSLPVSRDTITVFPTMKVTASRIRLLDREVLSQKGRLDLAQKKFISPVYRVTFGPLSQIGGYYLNFLSILNGWHPNEAEAMTLYYESDRVRILSEMDDLIRLESVKNPKEADEFKSMRAHVWRTGVNSLYWNPFAGRR